MSSLQPAFTFQLQLKILPKSVAVGRLDGNHPSLVGATTNGKVFAHTPHGVSSESGGRLLRSEADVSIFNINQPVKAVAVGKLLPQNPNKDVLLVGTPTHALAYDVENNADLFYNEAGATYKFWGLAEVPDGVNCIAVGKLSHLDHNIAIFGGNCAIQGYDSIGNDAFWTVTGDNVSSLCLCDFDNDGELELVVGSEDYDIRVFKGDAIIGEMTETEAVTVLSPVYANTFAYALANGTLGVYQGTNRIWRIKSKNAVMVCHMYDIDGTGEQKLITGWSHGKVDFRSAVTGDVLMKEQLGADVAGIVEADYRMDSKFQLILVSTDGQVRGYLPPTEGGAIIEKDPSHDILHELATRQQNLQMELANYAENTKVAQQVRDGNVINAGDRERLGVIPLDTTLQTTIFVNPGSQTESPCVELFVSTSNDTLVRAVMVFAEGVFPGESHAVHPSAQNVSSSCKVQLRPDKDVTVDLHIKALVGYRHSLQYHVFELSRTLPRFCMYALCNEVAPQPSSYATFEVNERPQRVALWINENFLLQEEIALKSNGDLIARFFGLRGTGLIFIQMNTAGRVHIYCEDMELCGDVMQALGDYLGVKDLASTAEFPTEVDRLIALLEKVNAIYMVRDQMTADVADHSNLVKALLIRAEDARLMEDMVNMKRYYTQLYNLNQELISQYKVRGSNHEELLMCMKQVNQIIQKAGRLRIGQPKTAVISACREAIKTGSTDIIPKIIKTGSG